MKKNKLSKKGQKLFKVYALGVCVFTVMLGTSMTVFAADDPLAVVNNLSNFIFVYLSSEKWSNLYLKNGPTYI